MMRDLTLALAACVTVLVGCEHDGASSKEPMTTGAMSTPAATPQDWQKFATLKIAYGHQSVGAQIVSSIEASGREKHLNVPIAERRDAFTAPGIHHFRIGVNGDPQGKIQDFQKAISVDFAGSADIALMEFCYVDFDADTNATRLAQQYIAEIDELTARFPNTTFVPVTALLTTVQTGPKALVKRLLGREPAGYAENAQRKAFNDAIRSHYDSGNVLFDVAAIESREGHVAIERNGTRIEILDAALTSDGGHLNELGKQLLSNAFVHHLATLAPRNSMGS